MSIRRAAAAFVTASWFAIGAGSVDAQPAFPSKPIKIIVPVTTGGPSDLVARQIGRAHV